MPIHRLSPLLVNQIAAGEVIERPASIVKELVENALDAGATKIDVVIEQGGKSLVRVTDDGDGIAPDELELAVAPHATSKIAEAGDLDAIATMGFRGEALASIASVSRFALRSRRRGDDAASVIEGEGADFAPLRPEAGPPGTSVTVRNLFFNTPARRKFLKTDQTETTRCLDVVRKIALAHPDVGWSVVADDRSRLELPAGQTPAARALAVLGAELEPALVEVRSDEPGIRLWGLAGTPEIARPSSRHQYLYLNGRLIQDRSVLHAVREAYRGLIDPSRHPTIVLFLEMDPSTVDVNVHPAKAEVRFRDQRQVHRAVRHGLVAALRAADLMPELSPESSMTPDIPVAVPRMSEPAFGAGRGYAPARSAGAGGAARPRGPMAPSGHGDRGFAYQEVKAALAPETPENIETAIRGRHGEADATLPIVHVRTEALQVHASFIVTSDERGIVIIDQHALHERVMFEKLKARIAGGKLESQRLLVPATVPVEADQLEALEALDTPGGLLERLGIEASPMGPKTVAVHAFASLLLERGVDPIEFTGELLAFGARADGRLEEEAALHEVLDMMSCKAAVKAGDKLEPGEIAELVAMRETVERSSNCPHGRPTSLRVSIEELERRFGRR